MALVLLVELEGKVMELDYTHLHLLHDNPRHALRDRCTGPDYSWHKKTYPNPQVYSGLG